MTSRRHRSTRDATGALRLLVEPKPIGCIYVGLWYALWIEKRLSIEYNGRN